MQIKLSRVGEVVGNPTVAPGMLAFPAQFQYLASLARGLL